MSDWLPPLLFFALVALSLTISIRRAHQRRLAFLQFAVAHRLLYQGSDWPPGIPHPRISRWPVLFSWPSCSNVISGIYRGANVVAFDYRIGFGRNARYGSGVGLNGVVPATRLPLLRNMELDTQTPWTFLITRMGFLRTYRRLEPEQVEQLWNSLINAAVTLRQPGPSPQAAPGGLHIRPRH